MKLTFEKIEYKNIMSVGQQPVIIDIMNNKKTLVTGKNGGGKSTMLEALCFALFGKPFRNIKKGQLVNSINKKALRVDLWFNDGRHNYQITRGIKPNIFEIKKDSEEMPESASTKDFQVFFEEEILRMNMNSFKQTIILGTAGYVPFMGLPAGSRRSLIEDLINLSIFSKMDALNKSVVKEIKTQMDTIEIRLNGLRNEYDAHLQHIEKQKSMSDTFIAELSKNCQEHAAAAKSLNDEIQQLTEQMASVIMGDDMTGSINKYNQALTMISTKVGQLESQKSFFDKNDVCPTCRQSINPVHKASIVDDVEHQCSGLEDKRDKAKEAIASLETAQAAFREATQTIGNFKSAIAGKRQLMSREVDNAKRLKSQIETAKSSVDIDTNRVDALGEEIEHARTSKTDLFEEMYARKVVLNMLKDSGIKSVIMKRYVPVINKKINHYLKLLGADYTFALDNEFNEVIKSRGREDFSYTSFSQGEKARIDLSLLFTWRDVAAIVSGTEINLLILDEIADGATDGEGVVAIHKILDSLNGNVIVISHREEHDKDQFNQHLRMVKKGRFSVME